MLTFSSRWMRRLSILALTLLSSLFPLSIAFAQSDDAAGAGGLVFWCLCCGVGLLINIAILYWVWTDANKRGSNGVVWAVVVFFFGILGLLAYLVMRPQGKLVPCKHCGQLKPISAMLCPHCGKPAN